jgi:hypothetical protein
VRLLDQYPAALFFAGGPNTTSRFSTNPTA